LRLLTRLPKSPQVAQCTNGANNISPYFFTVTEVMEGIQNAIFLAERLEHLLT